MRSTLSDLCAIVGAVVTGFGFWSLAHWLGFAVFGVLLLGFAWLLDRDS